MVSEFDTNVKNKNGEVLINLLNSKESVSYGPTFGKRHLQVLGLTSMIFSAFAVRTTLSVAIVAMTDATASVNKDIPTYNWTDKSLVVGAFLWGYCIPQVAAGFLAERYGAKWFLVCGITITAIAGLLIPTAAQLFGSHGVIACRVLQGLSQGFLYPSIQATLGKWVPSNERSRLGTSVFLGGPFGIVASTLLTGYISASSYGWPYAFYFFNSLTLLFCALYAYIGCSDPNLHTTITEEEKLYIKNNLATNDNRRDLPIPWTEIFTSSAFWSLVITNIAFNYTHWTLITETPIYMNKVMNFDLKSNSILSSLPYILEVIIGFATCFIADYVLIKKILSTTMVRKIANNMGLLVSVVALFVLGRTESEDAILGVILIVLVNGFSGTSKSGHNVNHMDLAPNFSGILMGLTNGAGVICSAFAPIVAQIFVTNEEDVNQWKIIFYICMVINAVAMITNSIFASGKRQPWNQGSLKKLGMNSIKAITNSTLKL